jgi:hypothetical protein
LKLLLFIPFLILLAPPVTFVTKFQWEKARFSVKKSLPELTRIVEVVCRSHLICIKHHLLNSLSPDDFHSSVK